MTRKKTTKNELEKSPEPAMKNNKKPERVGTKSLGIIAVIIVIAIAAISGISWNIIEKRFNSVKQEIERLESRANKLQVQLSVVTSQLQKETSSSVTRTETYQDYLTSSGGGEELAERVAKLEERVAEQIIKQASKNKLLTALLTLRDKIDTASPFEQELENTLTMVDSIPELKLYVGALKQYAKTGILTTQDLRNDFSDIASDIIVSMKDNESSGVWDKVKGNLSSVITIRRVGDIEGDGIEAVVARIEYLLEKEQLEEAVSIAEELKGEQEKVIAEWLKKAQGALLAQQMFNAIHTYIGTEGLTENKKSQIDEEVQEDLLVLNEDITLEEQQ